jgi:hypothetical protein
MLLRGNISKLPELILTPKPLYKSQVRRVPFETFASGKLGFIFPFYSHFLLFLFLATKTQSSPSRVQKGKGKEEQAADESSNSCMSKVQKGSLQLIFYSRLFHLQL